MATSNLDFRLYTYDIQRGVLQHIHFLSKSLQVMKCILAWLGMADMREKVLKDIFYGSVIWVWRLLFAYRYHLLTSGVR